ncbi:hypothetical protein GOV12_04440 [Candidatus Pacearchaeota archaeon]|nr:hypothetical protein [Candidatus Pacearchaeota archaeon]
MVKDNINSNRRYIRGYGRYSSRKRFELQKRELNKEEISEIKKYLDNPTNSGIWILKAKWMEFEGVSLYLKNEIQKFFESEKQESSYKIKLNELEDIDKDELISNIKGLTFIFNLFSYLCAIDKRDKPLLKYLESHDDEIMIISKIVNLKSFKIKYQDALNYFKNNINYDHFYTSVKTNKITPIQNGFFVYIEVERPRDDFHKDYRNLYLTSTSPEPLECLKLFYEKLDKIKDIEMLPIYSPQEEVFTPYFAFLEPIYPSFISDIKINELIRDAISEYDEMRYPYCIHLIGLVSEEYFVQIYETLFREICSENPLGKIYNSIGNKIKDISEIHPKKEPDFELLYQEIKKLQQRIREGDDKITKEFLVLLSKIVSSIKENKKYICERIVSTQNKNIPNSIFPKQLQENIRKLIEYRNMVSHRGESHIGEPEALKTVYYCITLILWWNREKELIDWKKHKVNTQEVIEEITKRNHFNSN